MLTLCSCGPWSSIGVPWPPMEAAPILLKFVFVDSRQPLRKVGLQLQNRKQKSQRGNLKNQVLLNWNQGSPLKKILSPNIWLEQVPYTLMMIPGWVWFLFSLTIKNNRMETFKLVHSPLGTTLREKKGKEEKKKIRRRRRRKKKKEEEEEERRRRRRHLIFSGAFRVSQIHLQTKDIQHEWYPYPNNWKYISHIQTRNEHPKWPI